MPEANISLRAVLVKQYDHLVRQLERRLKSADLAQDALHDAYISLERGKEIRPLERPVGYLYRIAVNLARKKLRANQRLLSVAEIETEYDIADEAPDPAKVMEAVSELDAVKRALADLPERRRAILMAASQESLPSREIAKRFGLSVRKIDKELQLAREHCFRVAKRQRRK